MKKWTPEEVRMVKSSLAPWATDGEIRYFLRTCSAYGLDPFRREIVLVRRRRRTADGREEVVSNCIITRDGYLQLARRDPSFVTVHSAAVYENDEFEVEYSVGGDASELVRIRHRFTGRDRGKLIGAWAAVIRKDAPPFGVYVSLDQYPAYELSATWKQFQAAMIVKTAEIQVLRKYVGGPAAGEEEVALPEELEASGEEPDQLLPEGLEHEGEGPGRAERVPGPTEFWKAVGEAARPEGISPQDWVRERTGGEVDIRKIPADVVISIYHEALERAGIAHEGE